jgi:hypothetical protein
MSMIRLVISELAINLVKFLRISIDQISQLIIAVDLQLLQEFKKE